MSSVDETAARAAASFRRVQKVMQAVEGPQWPGEAAEEVEFRWTGRGRPFFKIGLAAYTLEDETVDPDTDLVIEVTPGWTRLITAEGVRSVHATGEPDRAHFQ